MISLYNSQRTIFVFFLDGRVYHISTEMILLACFVIALEFEFSWPLDGFSYLNKSFNEVTELSIIKHKWLDLT